MLLTIIWYKSSHKLKINDFTGYLKLEFEKDKKTLFMIKEFSREFKGLIEELYNLFAVEIDSKDLIISNIVSLV